MAAQTAPLPTALESPSDESGAFNPRLIKYLSSVRDVLNDINARMSTTVSDVDPTTDNIPDGENRVWKNTTSGDLKLFANDGGTLKSVTLT